MDINGFANIDTKEGTTVDIDRVGLPCNENPATRAPVVKKLFVELDSKGGMPPSFEKTSGPWIDICMSEFNRSFFNQLCSLDFINCLGQELSCRKHHAQGHSAQITVKTKLPCLYKNIF